MGERDKSDISTELELGEIPPRSTLHPSNRYRMLRIFYGVLTFLFISLMVGLFLWGYRLSNT